MSNHAASQTKSDHGNPDPTSISGPWPWYVLVFIGYAVSGFFPWVMIAWGLYRRDRKSAAGWILAVNLVILICSGWLMLTLKMVWWWLTILALSFNFAWTVAAVAYQLLAWGAAGRRYHLQEWKSWIKPIVIGLIIGFCIGTIFSIIPAIENRIPMKETLDSLDRQIVLWSTLR